jgi:hypothetical protein
MSLAALKEERRPQALTRAPFLERRQAQHNQKSFMPSCLEADASTGGKHFFLKKEAKTFGHLA